MKKLNIRAFFEVARFERFASGVVLMEICCIYKGKHTVEVEGGVVVVVRRVSRCACRASRMGAGLLRVYRIEHDRRLVEWGECRGVRAPRSSKWQQSAWMTNERGGFVVVVVVFLLLFFFDNFFLSNFSFRASKKKKIP